MAYYYCRFDSPARLAERLAQPPRREWLPPFFRELGAPIPPSPNPWIGPLVCSITGPFTMRCFGVHSSDWQETIDRYFLTLETLEQAHELDTLERPACVVDAPVDERSVLWRVVALHYHDGSRREIVRDVRLPEARLYALALLGLNNPKVKVEVESRLCDAIGAVPVPEGLDWQACCEYPTTSSGYDNWRSGLVDALL